MGKERKIHGTVINSGGVTYCGVVSWTVQHVYGWVFDKLKEKYKCKKCEKKRNSRN